MRKESKLISPLLTVSMAVLILLKMYWGKCLHNLVGQPIPVQGLDNTLWIFHFTGISTLFTAHKYIAYSVDMLVATSFLILIFYQKRVFLWWVFILFIFYHFSYEIYSGHFHKLDVIVVLFLFTFLWANNQRQLLWEGIRYYLIMVMLSSAAYKLFNGALLFPSHFANVLMAQHADIGMLHSHSYTTRIAEVLIAYPYLGFALFAVLFALQIFFTIGFFTKRMDKVLFVLVLVFIAMDYFLMRIWALDLLLAAYTLILPSWYSSVIIRK